MVEVKDKSITAESLKLLHKHNEQTYMPMSNPAGSGTMTMNGDADFSGAVNVGSLMIGSNLALVPTGTALEIVFLDEEES